MKDDIKRLQENAGIVDTTDGHVWADTDEEVGVIIDEIVRIAVERSDDDWHSPSVRAQEILSTIKYNVRQKIQNLGITKEYE